MGTQLSQRPSQNIVTRRIAISLLGGTPFVWAQQSGSQGGEDLPTIRVDVDLVNVLFSVRDKKGALVPALTRDDFSVYEDGKKQEIKYFAHETDLPLTLGLLVDVSGSQGRLIPEEKAAAAQFFQQVLRKKDMAFLISFGADADLLQDLTGSPALLREALNELRLNSGVGGIHPGPVPTASKPKGTILYDAVYLAASEKLKSEVGRKAIVLISDGMDFGSTYTRQQAIEAAHRADTLIYSIYFVDHAAYGFGNGGMMIGGASDGDLKKMSEETGGRLFHVSNSNTLKKIFDDIQAEMRSQYVIGYSSNNENSDGGFRKLEIKPTEKNLKVQARKGYFARRG